MARSNGPVIIAMALLWLAGSGYLWVTVHRRRKAAPVLSAPSAPPPGRISVIVPARDEERSIGPCVASLLAQDHPDVEVIVVDDGSADATAAIAAASGARVIPAGPLPPGWAGKPHACAVGAEHASGDWLVFVDADTIAEPGLLGSAVQHAETRGLDVLSPNPAQEVVTFWERVVVPAGFLLLVATRDLRRINDPESTAAAVNGQCVVVRAGAYRAIGGHGSVAGEVLEDVAFGATAKRRGLRLEIADGSAFIRTRMYRSWSEIWSGLTKNAALVAGGPFLAFPAALGLAVLAAAPVAIPALAVASGGPAWAVAVAIAGSLVFAAVALRGPRFFGLRWWWGLTLPLGLAAASVITAASALKTWRGSRVWKGRRY